MLCAESGDLPQRNVTGFTIVTCVVNLAPLSLYPRERIHSTRKI